jgi:hypothetical protein
VKYLALAATAAALSACTGERSTEPTPSTAPVVTAPAPASSEHTAPSKNSVESPLPAMVVIGTVVAGSEKSALVRVALEAPYTVRVGDSIRQEQVVAIEFDSIVLAKGDAKRRIPMAILDRQEKPSLATAVSPQSADNLPQLPLGFTPSAPSSNPSFPEDLSSNRAFEKFIRERTGPS